MPKRFWHCTATTIEYLQYGAFRQLIPLSIDMAESAKTQNAGPSRREWFDALVDLDVDQRAQLLHKLALLPEDEAAVLALLAAAELSPSAVLQTPAQTLVDTWRGDQAIAQTIVGQKVGSFTVSELLGHGGSSIVYKAQREVGEGAQVVALKLLQTGIYSPIARRRFSREQAILATLTHPNIARLIEGGVSAAGIPYIAMEFVDGQPITRHLDAIAAPLVDRLRLFRALCLAVEAAHAALVVHRDLKPSNVYVDGNGDVKVLDFGLAKLLDDDDAATTQTQGIMLTPDYAAPEQFHIGAVTTAADVYALGVLLGELLTGQLLGWRDALVASIVVSEKSLKPPPNGLPGRGLLARQLRGDLDAIISNALAEEPGRRYKSAGALADDIERFLEGQPVRAHPPSNWYRVQKFVRRHRGGVLLTGVLLIVILASLATSMWQWQVAKLEAQRASVVRDFLVRLFTINDTGAPRDTVPTTQMLLHDAGLRIDSQLAHSPLLHAQMQLLIGNVSRDLGLLDEAGPLLRAAAQSADGLFEEGDVPWLEAKVAYGEYLVDHAEYVVAKKLFDDILEKTRPARANADLRSKILRLRAHANRVSGNPAAAKLDLGQAHALVISLHGKDSEQAYRLLEAEAEFAFRMADYKAALQLKREQLEFATHLFGPDHAEVFKAHYLLAETLHRAGDLAEAEQLILGCEKDFDRYFERPNETLINILSTLGSIQLVKGELAAAQKTFERAYQLQTHELQGSQTIGNTLHNLAAVAKQRGDLQSAQRYSSAAVEAKQKSFGALSAETGGALRLLGQIQAELKQYEMAIRTLTQSNEALRSATSADNPTISNNYVTLAKIALERGQFEPAQTSIRIAVEGLRKAYGESHRFTVTAKILAAKVDLAKGDARAALLNLRDLESVIRAGDNAVKALLAPTLELIGEAELALANKSAAQVAWREALSLRLAASMASSDANVQKLNQQIRSLRQ
jgi:eukaryotic-like serine/threonine-protein kinase